MPFFALLEALFRIASDPRIHPSTQVRVALEIDHDLTGNSPELEMLDEPLAAISLDHGTLVLSAVENGNVVAR